MCDYCKNPASVKELARSARLCQTGRKSLGTQIAANASFGRPDPMLYGGGKFGYERLLIIKQ